jgi:alkyldihydroxyacetonephosphate synthase
MRLVPAAVGIAAQELSRALPRDVLSTDPVVLDRYTADTYWKALAARARGSPLGRPDIVIRPISDEHVALVLEVANRCRVPVVPWGGGSGTQGACIPVHGGIVVDLTGMNRIIEIDGRSLTVTAEAGLNGRTLETDLNARGLMLPHYPASSEYATVGGYVAARGSGVLSTRYGKIEDLVLSLRVVTPTGETVDTVSVPRHAVGPELTQLYIGSEGTLGVITRVTLQLARLPMARRFEAVSFPTVAAGVDAIREALARGIRPSVVRMYDEEATKSTLSPVVSSDLSGVATVLCFEGEPGVVAAEAAATLALAREAGAVILGGNVAQTWWDHRYDFYHPPHRPELPAIWGTIDVVAKYSKILAVYAALKEAIEKPYAARGLRLKIHFSHWYAWGTMIYGRFQVPDGGPDALELHDQIWEDGVRAALNAGAVMNDHHGVGLKLAPYMRAQQGVAFGMLRRIKDALDPNGIMNPGKMGL